MKSLISRKQVNNKKPGICLVGLGPHAKRIYYNYIERDVLNKKLDFYLLVDLYSKEKDIEDFCLTKKIKPKNIFLSKLPNQIRPQKLDPKLIIFLDEAIKDKKIQYAIVSTEPKAHKVYIEYFLKNKIPVLTDKPLTAPVGANYDIKSAKQIYTDAIYLSKLSKIYNTPLYIQVQRREHLAYQFIFNEINKVINEYKVPVTYFDIYHSDGQWNMPDEFKSRENHPYKYGYGKILHSGYHFADLVAWIIESNKILFPNLCVQNNTQLLKPMSHYKQIKGSDLYKKIFNKDTLSPLNKKMGEVDSYSSFVFRDGSSSLNKDNIVTYGNLNMLQSGFSKRSWYELPVDTYKGNGRLRHEYFNINVGSLLNIQFHSYQSEEINAHLGIKGVGSENHLDVYLFRNEKIIGGKPLEKIDFGLKVRKKFNKSKFYLGHNETARHIIYKQMINNSASSALIQNQLLTNKILSHMYESSILDSSSMFKLK